MSSDSSPTLIVVRENNAKWLLPYQNGNYLTGQLHSNYLTGQLHGNTSVESSSRCTIYLYLLSYIGPKITHLFLCSGPVPEPAAFLSLVSVLRLEHVIKLILHFYETLFCSLLKQRYAERVAYSLQKLD